MLTIDVKTSLLCLLIIVVIILVIYGIYAVFNLVKTIKQANKVLADFEVVSKIASERSQQLDKFIDQTSKKIKSGQNIINSLPVIVSTVSKIAKVVGQQMDRKAESTKK